MAAHDLAEQLLDALGGDQLLESLAGVVARADDAPPLCALRVRCWGARALAAAHNTACGRRALTHCPPSPLPPG